MATVLVAENDAGTIAKLRDALALVGHTVIPVASSTEAMSSLSRSDVDVLLCDVGAPEIAGLDLCARVVANRPDIPVVLTSADAHVEIAIGAIRAGAFDFLTKPTALADLLASVERAARHGSLQRRIRALRRDDHGEATFDEMIGHSPSMREVFDMITRVADTDASVLLVGPSGTGKELAARALHARSKRRDEPFVSVNCAAIPEALLDTELFGREGSAGLFERAQGGTLHLDEIGEMPLNLQPKLLRALQQPNRVRLVAATLHDLEAAVEERSFRSDLFFRINVVQIIMPPLRARGTDILLLADHFLKRFAARDGKPIVAISPAAAEQLYAYDWPGHVRELQNSMERAVALGRFDAVGLDDLPEKIRAYSPNSVTQPTDASDAPLTLQEVGKRYIVRVLAMAGGNKTIAARWLGIDRKTLYRKLGRTLADAEEETA